MIQHSFPQDGLILHPKLGEQRVSFIENISFFLPAHSIPLIPSPLSFILEISALISYAVLFLTALSSKACPVSSAFIRCDNKACGLFSRGPSERVRYRTLEKPWVRCCCVIAADPESLGHVHIRHLHYFSLIA